MAKTGHYKSWLQAAFDALSSWKFGYAELIVAVALLIFVIVVIYLYDRFCDSHVDPNVEMEPTELEMRELPRPFVDFPIIDYVRLNQRELEHILKEEDTYSTASTIPLEMCVMITENIRRRASQGSIWIEHEEEEEEEEEEQTSREPARDIVDPDTVERNIDRTSNRDDDIPDDEETDRVTDEIDGSETIDFASNPSDSIAIPIENDNSSESIAIPIKNDNPSESIAIPIEGGNPSESIPFPIDNDNPSDRIAIPIEDDNL